MSRNIFLSADVVEKSWYMCRWISKTYPVCVNGPAKDICMNRNRKFLIAGHYGEKEKNLWS